jgi:hypothetical protein
MLMDVSRMKDVGIYSEWFADQLFTCRTAKLAT